MFFRIKPFFLAFLLSLLLARPGLAIGPGTGGSKIRVGDERVGPYVLLVATSPLPVKVGQMSVWVRAASAADPAQLRPDAVVTVTARPAEGGAAQTAQASHQNAGNEVDYVAHLEVERPGEWEVTVQVADELGQAEVTFTETVSRAQSPGLLLGLALPFVALAALVGVYLWRRSPAEDVLADA